MYAARRPALSLAHAVDTLWYCEDYRAQHRYERVLPNGRFQLIINLDTSDPMPPLVTGMRSRHTVLDTSRLRAILGVLFEPGGAHAFFDPPAAEFFNLEVPLDLLWGSHIAALRHRLREAPTVEQKFQLLEAELHRRLNQRRQLHPSVREGLIHFHRLPHITRVDETAKDNGLSRRRFTELFREQIGMTPKLYCRLLRFRAILAQAAQHPPADWAGVAFAGGYCDQAHMAHEFKEFSGISLSQYLASDRPFLSHVAIPG